MFKLRRRLMRDYGAACVVRYFENLPAQHPAKAQIEEALHYFRTNLARMDYGTYRKSGYFIGSGAMEGTCKSLVNQRTDLAGQRWHPSGSLNVLRCRALVASLDLASLLRQYRGLNRAVVRAVRTRACRPRVGREEHP